MSSRRTNRFARNGKKELIVYGYIRENFDKKFCVEEIMAIIIEFHKIKGGSLYMCGEDKYGRLGIGKYKNCRTPTLCPPFTNNNAFKVVAAKFHTLILDTEGDVWSCGCGSDGQLGNGRNVMGNNYVYVPKKLQLGIRVIGVGAGQHHSLLLCQNGTVKVFGLNHCGQLGIENLEKTFFPKTIEKLKQFKIVEISAGCATSAALIEDGHLFCFGSNFKGQCGVGEGKGRKINIPTKVIFDDEIEFVDCGDGHTLLITNKGSIYSTGAGKYGKLGHGNEEDKYEPTLIELLREKRMINCAGGKHHSVCIDKEGIIWSFGRNDRGQCGVSKNIKEQRTPKMIPWFVKNNIKAKECAVSLHQSSVITNDGSLYVFGLNYENQLGLRDRKIHYTPTKLSIFENMTVQSISMACFNSAIICRSP